MTEQEITELVEQLKTREVKIYERDKKGCLKLARTARMDYDAALDQKFSGRYPKVEISGPEAWVLLIKGVLAIRPLWILDICEASGNSSHMTDYRRLRNYNDFVLLAAAEEIEVYGITLPEGQAFYYPRALSRRAFRTKEEALKPRRMNSPFKLSAYTANGDFVEKPPAPTFFPISQPYSTPR
jgi:hypothetical protein